MRRVIAGIIAGITLSAFIILSGASEVRATTPRLDISVIPSVAPVGPVSPSWDHYVTNALEAIPAKSNLIGWPSQDPAAYQTVGGPISPLEIVYTGGRGASANWFNSWHAMADGNAAFDALPAAFKNEYGARLHFGLHVISDGTVDFSLDGLSWELNSNDSTNYFDQDGTFSGASYSPTRIGINYGPNGTKGGGDDIVYDNGEAGSTLINELIYVGVGDGFFSDEPGLSGQADIDATLTDLLLGCVGIHDCSFDFEGIYSLDVPGQTQPLVGSSMVRVDLKPAFGGDLDHDGSISSADKDILTNALAGGGAYNVLYDTNGDGALNFTDLDVLVHDIAGTTFGDANCDGVFDSGDLVQVFIAGKYDTNGSAVWSQGDFNADGVFDSGDLVLAFVDGGYVNAATAAAVPEPSAVVLALLGCVALLARRR